MGEARKVRSKPRKEHLIPNATRRGRTMIYSKFGAYLRELRLQAGYGLREFCVRFEFDPAFISKLERGRVKVPGREKLEEIAQALELVESSSERVEFMTLADIEAERIPKEILEDEEALELLPAVFRTFQNEKADKDHLRQLVELLKKA